MSRIVIFITCYVVTFFTFILTYGNVFFFARSCNVFFRMLVSGECGFVTCYVVTIITKIFGHCVFFCHEMSLNCHENYIMSTENNFLCW